MNNITIDVVGNPNCGKTTLFNALTGARQRVGNWPGVTVEKKTGAYAHKGVNVEVIDLPGVYSLSSVSSVSVDEHIARDHILSGKPDLVVNIIDASNLERNLYLTTQLLEMRVPMVVVLNMMDVARDRRLDIDLERLRERLGCPVIPLVASKGEGVEELRALIDEAARSKTVPSVTASYSGELEEALSTLTPLVEKALRANHTVSPRWVAVQLMEGDADARQMVEGAVDGIVARHIGHIEERMGEDLDTVVADGRYGFITGIVQGVVDRKGQASRTLTDRIDRVVLHRALGIPIFLAVMYLMFMFTINVGGAFIDFFDIFAGTLLVDGVGTFLEGIETPAWITALLAGGVGGGIQTVATFIPVIVFLYLFLSVLEDSGYMARAAFVMDRSMRGIGLPGKAFVPLIVGFGCNVPSAMAARTMENQRDRIITVMMAPFMSCGARLPVYVLFAAAFFPTGGQNLVFALYLIGIGIAVITGLVLKNTLLQGEAAPFVMELPPYHAPTLKGVLIRTWDRLKTFMLRAGKVIVAIVVVLSFLNSWGTDGSFGNEDSDRSVLAAIGKSLTPVVEPMGITEDNWPATVGIFTGIFAKEAVVGTLDALYGTMAAEEAGAGEEAPFDLWGGLGEAFTSIPANLADVVDTIADPLGIGVGDTSDTAAVAEDQEVMVGTIGTMAKLFDGRIGAFAYLLAVLLYLPCVAAVAAIWREVGTRWTLFAAAWTTGWGYGAAVLVYQAGTFAQHPLYSGVWIAIILTVFASSVVLMRQLGRRTAAGVAITSEAVAG
uniref:Ferrous iron transport protein B n=1 Tax=Candidatus Kentrum sp. FM TaxID=2126340 RepID=A0A450TKJ2_9GAMM|nr:MAG: ferrous iron transport protein B [Candidatus Kentron sp. FM]VFJ68061.1 MAG: ferrous iron transport protein B [Candidatus Kentron sp. FM]VFK13858.1 MAG: ferrous iron transport protein B [Candidatus Kentron sp. FM]